MIIRLVERQERPRGDEPSNVTQHDVCADGARARCVADHVCGDLGVAEGAEGKGAAGDEEGGAVAGLRVGGGEEHNVAHHNEGRGADEED